MTPEERNLVTELFDRLATLEDTPRDREAERLIQDGLRRAPNAPYAMAQTMLIQDEALKRADGRIRELEAQLGIGAEPQRQGGFLDGQRDSVWGRRDAPRAGSVPTVRPSGEPMGAPVGAPPGYRAEAQPMGQQPMAQQPMGQQPMGQPSGGSSFLGTAAAAAVGVIGGSLLMNSMRSMMGGQHGGSAHAAFNQPDAGRASPWSGGDGNLAREAGVDDIGRGSGTGGGAPRNYGLVDNETSETSGANDAADDNANYAADDQGDVGEFEDDTDLGGDLGGGGDEE